MWHFRGSKYTLTPPTYFQGESRPTEPPGCTPLRPRADSLTPGPDWTGKGRPPPFSAGLFFKFFARAVTQCIWQTASRRLPTPRAPLWFISSRSTYNSPSIIAEADETLFNNIRHNSLHILQPLLPKQIDYCYSLRPRSHNFELTHNHDNRNFIDRMLFCNPCSLA